ncbi:DNA polymerase [Bordetella genomosp. 9]|uniref:DNA polymerase n=1 Tax=Bordetella genomosp. 9 TaxID=1416803 RepID=UPI0026B45A36|nr:DNA polymerase [Bordetella genomosp. 9]
MSGTPYRVWDLETSTKTEFKRKANPFSAENYIVCQGWQVGNLSKEMKGGVTPSDYFPDGDDQESRVAACKALPQDWFTKHLQGTKLLVGQNIKFDLLYALANPNSRPEHNLQAWMDYINAGGMIWDIQLAEYLLAGMEQSSHMLSLDEIAPAYGGNVKLDEVKALWDSGVDTIDIPEDLLLRYLAGRETEQGFEEGDIGNTERVFRGQWLRAKQSGQLRSILLNMGALVFTIECERNGMHVDKQLGLELAEKLAKKLAEATLQLETFLPEGLPFEFNWNSRFHKSALIFGGTVKYDAPALVLGEDGNRTYYQKKELHALLNSPELPSWPLDKVLADMAQGKAWNVQRYAGGRNKGEIKTKQVTVPDIERGPKTRIEPHYYTFEGFTKPDPAWEGADKGVYSTASEVMDILTQNTDVPFLKTLGQVVKLTKDLGTYFITTDEDGNQKGMLTLVQLDSIIHHMLNHTSTVTARLSSSNPNLQNIPKGQKSEAKTVFKSRFGKDGVIIQSDFSSLEVYVQAILTRCAQLIADLKAGVDMHVMRLSVKEGMEYDEVYRLCKGKDVEPELQKDWDYKRTGAKVFSFQRAYGAGVKKIAQSTKMAEADVQALADAENARYPEIEPYFEDKAKEIRKSRVPTGLTVQHPEIPGLNIQLGKGYSVTPDGKRYCYREHPAPKWLIERGRERSGFMPTEIKNYEVQGTGGEWAKAAMWLSVRAFYHFRNFDGKGLLVNQVHDAEYADAHKSVRSKVAALLHVCMEEASTFIEWWFKWELPLGVPSDTVWGSSMAEEKEIETANFDKAVQALRPWVRKRFIGKHIPSYERSL